MAGWNADAAAGPLGSTVTLVDGANFCLSSANGDISPDQPQGLFYEDTRILSRWILTVDGQLVEPLAAETREPYRGHFAGRVPQADRPGDSTLIVERSREVGAGILERITVRNYSSQRVECVVAVTADSDFADVFEVKEARIRRQWQQTRERDGDSLVIRATWQGESKAVVIKTEGGTLIGDAITFTAAIAPPWRLGHGTQRGAGPEKRGR